MGIWLESISGTSMRWLNETLMDYTDIILSFTRTELGNIFDAGIDYQALINQLPELVDNGSLTQEDSNALKELLLYNRQEKTSVSKPYREYYNNEHPKEYGFLSEMEKDYSALIQAIINKANNDQNGQLSEEQYKELANLETQRNQKIYRNGLDYEQTSEYSKYGSKTFSDFVDNDYMASIRNMENRIQKLGRTFTESELKQLREWEILRNQKILNSDMSDKYNPTYKYHSEIEDEYIPVPINELLIPSHIAEHPAWNTIDDITNSAVGNAMNNTLSSLLNLIQPLSTNNNSDVVNNTYQFGDIILRETIKDGSAFISSLVTECARSRNTTKNLK